MRNNIFTFGDLTNIQDRGTGMGTLQALMWANLYMSIKEDTFIQPFNINIMFYKRFIDDVIGLTIVIAVKMMDLTVNLLMSLRMILVMILMMVVMLPCLAWKEGRKEEG
jgi:hypothetical protein